ncbi:MAG: tetratricopeptide repeat protein [Flavobacteriales bacterium]
MRSHPVILTIFLLLACVLQARGGAVRSGPDTLLTTALDQALPDTVRLMAMQQLTSGFMRTAPDSCLHYAARYAELATKLGNAAHQANAAHLKGVAAYLLGQLDESLAALDRSVALRKDLDDPLAKAATLNLIGAVYMQKGDLARAMDNYVQCLQLSEKAGDRRGIAGSHHNIGRIYAQQNDLDKALEHFQTSLVNREPDDLLGRAGEIDLMASTFADAGQGQHCTDTLSRSTCLACEGG